MSRKLEITILNGENLRIDRKSVKKNATVNIRTDSQTYTTAKNDVAKGGSFPSWNSKMVVELPAHVSFITIEVHIKTSMGDKLVGGVNVPVTDFVGGLVRENYLHFLSYRLRDGRGERNGIINLSARVVKVPEYGCSGMAPPRLGFPVNEKNNICGGVVTGVPAVWFTCPV